MKTVPMEHLTDAKISFPMVERMELTYFVWLYLSKETELLAKLAHLCEVVKLRTLAGM